MERGEVFVRIPNELAIGGVYMPPLLLAAIIGTLLALVTASLLNRTRLSRHFFYPPLVFVAMTVVYTVVIGTFFIPV
jgi:hypothetical protein